MGFSGAFPGKLLAAGRTPPIWSCRGRIFRVILKSEICHLKCIFMRPPAAT